NACGDSRLRGLRSRKPIGFRRWVVHCSKRKFSGPYKLFLGYGILQAALLGFNVIGMVIWGANNETAYFNFAVGMIGAMITATLYFLLYRMEKKSSNRYYLVAISIWGIIAIAMPFYCLQQE
ncbi:MAG: hypothetical protein K2O96_04245, partial [Lachnospiraceae bacterium]|nr:hypothetical protein [Lachnospiraceae bacterium]